MGNGYPIAAVCCRREWMDRFNTHPEGDVFLLAPTMATPWDARLPWPPSRLWKRSRCTTISFGWGRRCGPACRIWSGAGSSAPRLPGLVPSSCCISWKAAWKATATCYGTTPNGLLLTGASCLSAASSNCLLNLKRNHISFSHDDHHIEQALEAAEDVLRQLA